MTSRLLLALEPLLNFTWPVPPVVLFSSRYQGFLFPSLGSRVWTDVAFPLKFQLFLPGLQFCLAMRLLSAFLGVLLAWETREDPSGGLGPRRPAVAPGFLFLISRWLF